MPLASWAQLPITIGSTGLRFSVVYHTFVRT